MPQKWRYRETILTLLAEAALLPATSDEQTALLNEAGILLWRFDDSVYPKTATDLLPLLGKGIQHWLPRELTFGFTGCLISNGNATILADELLVEMSSNALVRRDLVVSQALSELANEVPRLHSFRDLVDRYKLDGFIKSNYSTHPKLIDCFYEFIPYNDSDTRIPACPKCGYPFAITGEAYQCRSTFCNGGSYSKTPPYSLVTPSRRLNFPRIFAPGDYFKLNCFAWRTLGIPLLIERKILNWALGALPANQNVTVAPIRTNPGVTVYIDHEPISLEPIMLNHTKSIADYFLAKDTLEEKWIILPRAQSLQSYNLRRMLPKNYVIATDYSFTKQFLSIKFGIGARYQPNRYPK